MTIVEAFEKRSTDGGCVRRSSWPPHVRVFVVGLEIFWADRMTKWIPDVDDVLATDYEMAELRPVPPL
jgi:hypothetical protein